MKKVEYRRQCLTIVFLILVLAVSTTGQTYITGGDVSGLWTSAGSPFYIQGEITVPNDETLTIEQGVNVIFLGHYKFYILGKLIAIGTQQDSIHFTSENPGSGWHGIRFMDTPNTNDTSKMIYCSFKYGKAYNGINFDNCGGAILIKNFDKVLVSNCLFDSNMNDGAGVPEAGPAIYIYEASATIMSSTFINNQGDLGSAIACVYSPESIIRNNVLSNNHGQGGPIIPYGSGSSIISGNIIFNNTAGLAGGGICVEMSASPRIENNIIYNNTAPYGGGILCYSNANAVIVNNTISNNISSLEGGGIFFTGNSDPILINNIIYGNSAPEGSQVYINDANSDPFFVYCDIQGGKAGFRGSGVGGNYSGLYENNIDTIPYFLDVNGDDFRLSDYSPCIGAGIDSIEIAGIWYYAPPFCIEGNPRPNPSGSMPDIGACENYLGIPLVGVEDETNPPTECSLEQNYPNPFNPSTTISWQSPVGSHQTIKVYDVLGNEIATLVDEYKPTGRYEVEFNTEKLSSGVYFYQLKEGDFVSTKKMILLK